LYTQELLKQMRVAGLNESDLFKQVRAGVLKATKGTKNEQVPWESSSLIGTFYFNPVVAAAPKPAPATPKDEGPEPVIARRDAKELERDAWLLVRNSTDAQDFRDFLEVYPNGANAANAKIKLEQLAWEAARANGSKAALEGYVKEFPQGDNVANARLMLSRLARANQPAPNAAPAAGNTASSAVRQQSNQYGIEFVAIAAGSFTMGSANGESDEKPAHQVAISSPFEIGKYEVTQEQWEKVMGRNPSYFKDCPKCPVEQVSWEDAQQFISQLNSLNDGYKYRLPTEAEWEYAARAGTSGDYAGVLEQMAWYSENSGGKTHPVGTKQPNAWGLYDMHGNVWEWVADWYDGGYYGKSPRQDPSGPSGGSYRVKRGGGWNYAADVCRAAYRGYGTPGFRISDLGLRLARTR
jgi:formylglycine-generating enzyme required for sulfatase activity